MEVTTDLYSAVVSSFGGRLASFRLFNYRSELDPDSALLDMVTDSPSLPLGVVWSAADGRRLDDSEINYRIESPLSTISGDASTTLSMSGRAPGGEIVTKTLVFHGNSYVIDYTVTITGRSGGPIGVVWTRRLNPAGSGRYVKEGPAALVDGKLESVSAADMDEPESFSGSISWGGYADHYFLAAYLADEAAPMKLTAEIGRGVGISTLWRDGAEESVSYRLFIGPKSLEVLRSVDPDLSGAVDLGIFSIIARPLLEAMLFLERFIGNFGWSIVLLTIALRVVFYPVNKKQAEAMKGMQKIQPEMKRIQERFKDDREQLNKEMMDLYRRHKVNPLSGCLPMLLQLPVFIGLYNALMQSIELRHAPFFGWITDLSQPDRLGSLPIPFVEPPGIPVLTLLMGVSMLLQQRMTPSAGDPAQQRMMMLMPVVFTVMFINFPSGLVLYWLCNNLLSIGQQYFTNKQKA